MPTFTPAHDVKEARRPDAHPTYRAAKTPLSNDFRTARICAAAQMISHGFEHGEAHAISVAAVTTAAVSGEADIFSAVMARAWGIAQGTRPLPRHPGGVKSDAWLALEAQPRWAGHAYDDAARSA